MGDSDKTKEQLIAELTDLRSRIAELEKELVKERELESFHDIADKIAHDFRNILTSIIGNISIVKHYTHPEDVTYERLIDAERGCSRARDMTEQLLDYADGVVAESSVEPGPPSLEFPLEEIPASGSGKVLVMDDEDMLKDVAENLLNTLGYKADFASDGAEAIKMYRKAMESGRPYDAVILDLTVPVGMGGLEAIGKLLEIDPSVKAIVSSGHSRDPVMSDFGEYGFRAAIAKPYKLNNLNEALQKALNN